MTAGIHVCPLSRLAETAATSRADHLVSLLSPQAEAPLRPPGILPSRHLTLRVSDIVSPGDGLTLAQADHLRDLLDFVRGWDRRRPLLIHCYAGVSRSTAAALIALCALMPERSEAAVAAALRAASPTATPNARLVALADDLLGREGRMIAAAAAIGRGAECAEGAPFALPVR